MNELASQLLEEVINWWWQFYNIKDGSASLAKNEESGGALRPSLVPREKEKKRQQKIIRDRWLACEIVDSDNKPTAFGQSQIVNSPSCVACLGHKRKKIRDQSPEATDNCFNIVLLLRNLLISDSSHKQPTSHSGYSVFFHLS